MEEIVEVVAHEASVAGHDVPLLPPTSFVAPPSTVTIVAGDPGAAQRALALALGGRIPLATGSIALDDDVRDATRRRAVTLVDVPEVTAPEEGLPVLRVVADELGYAHVPSRRADTERFLTGHGVARHLREPFERLDNGLRVRLLMAAAAERADARVLVLGNPERRGGDPRDWWPVAQDLAAAGATVIVQTTHATCRLLGVPVAFELGATP